MHRTALRSMLVFLLVVALLWGVSVPSEAQSQSQGSLSFPPPAVSYAVIAVVGVVVGVVAYGLSRAPRTTGCVIPESGGLALDAPRSGNPAYLLEGKTDSLHQGEWVTVVGRRHAGAGQRKVIRVKGVAKNYGNCPPVAKVGTPAVVP